MRITPLFVPVLLAGGLALTGNANAITEYHLVTTDSGFRFGVTDIGVYVETPHFPNAYLAAKADFEGATKIRFTGTGWTSLPPFPTTQQQRQAAYGKVAYIEADYGATVWQGITYAYDASGESCFNAQGGVPNPPMRPVERWWPIRPIWRTAVSWNPELHVRIPGQKYCAATVPWP